MHKTFQVENPKGKRATEGTKCGRKHQAYI
jgi:hypothetical protein